MDMSIVVPCIWFGLASAHLQIAASKPAGSTAQFITGMTGLVWFIAGVIGVIAWVRS